MKAIATLALALSFGSALYAQTPTSATSEASTSQTQEQPPKSLLDKMADYVYADFAVTWDGEEYFLARSDLEVRKTFGNRVEIFGRINFLPYARNSILEKLRKNEDVIEGVTAVIVQSVKNQIAVQLGIPADRVVVPGPVLQAALDRHLNEALESFINEKLSPDAQLDAAVRELGVAFTLVGADPEASQQLVLEVGKVDPMYMSEFGYFQNHFRLSRPSVRVKYANHNLGIVTYIEAGNDSGLWEIANPQANASREYIATILARSQGKFLDLTDVNSWEMGLIKYFGSKQKVVLAVGQRPLLDRGTDTQYVLGTYDVELAKFKIELQGSLESFEDPVFGETVVKRFEAGVSRTVKGFEIRARTYNRYDSLVRKDFNTVMAGVIKPLWNFSNFSIGVGGRAYLYKYTGVDENGEPNKWEPGFDVGAGFTFGKKPVSAADVLIKRNRELNEKRLKEQKQKANNNNNNSDLV